jgi:hypothetical protein
VWKQGLHLDPAIYLMNEESGGFGSGSVQMAVLSSSADTAAVRGVAKDGTTHSGYQYSSSSS